MSISKIWILPWATNLPHNKAIDDDVHDPKGRHRHFKKGGSADEARPPRIPIWKLFLDDELLHDFLHLLHCRFDRHPHLGFARLIADGSASIVADETKLSPRRDHHAIRNAHVSIPREQKAFDDISLRPARRLDMEFRVLAEMFCMWKLLPSNPELESGQNRFVAGNDFRGYEVDGVYEPDRNHMTAVELKIIWIASFTKHLTTSWNSHSKVIFDSPLHGSGSVGEDTISG